MLNLTDHHDILELADVKANALVYENAQGRDAQNASQMFTFLYASLSEEAKRMVLSDCEDYTIVTTAERYPIGNGPMFLKIIIRNSRL